MTTSEPAVGKLNLNVVVQRTIALVRRNWIPLLITSAVLAGLPSGALTGVGLGAGADAARFMTGGFGLFALLLLVLGALGNAVLYRLILTDLAGGRPELGQAFREGAGILLPVLGVSVLAIIGVALGLILLVVPGVILAIMWSVATVVVAAESPAVIEAFKRSAFLTKGNRWRIFGLVVLWAIASWLIQLITAIFGVFGAFVASTVLTAVGVSALVVLYDELRMIRDGEAI